MSGPANASAPYGAFARDLLPERIAARLVSLIAERRLRPGDRLPPERDLAAMMHVSRASLREALRGLAMMKVIEVRHGSGTYVAALNPGVLVEHLDFVFTLDDSTFGELLDARCMLEPAIAAAAASRATAAEIEELVACARRAASSADDANAFLEADVELHRLITAAAHNPIIARIMASLTRLGMASRQRTVGLPGVRAQSVRDHQGIVEALLQRDPGAAAERMRQHLEGIRNSLAESPAQDSERANPQGEEHVADHDLG